MSNSIRKLQSRYTGMRGIGSNKQLPMVSCERVEPTNKSYGYSYSEEYIMSIDLHTMFRCNQAQLVHAEELARKELAHYLYADVHHTLDRISMMLCEYDNPWEIREAIAELREVISE